MKKRIKVGNRTVGKGAPVFIVAELSGNHGGDFEKAKALVRAAARAGADAVKLQTYTEDTMTIDSDSKWFRVGGGGNPKEWSGKTLYALYREAKTPWAWHRPLKKLAESLGLIFFSTPFDASAVDFLETLAVPCYKIAAYEANDHELLIRVARTGKPVIISIGFLSLEELQASVKVLRQAGAEDIILLYSTASYAKAMGKTMPNLSVIPDLVRRFKAIAGFSDNSGGIEAPVLAAAAGASVIEKHLVLTHDSAVLDDQFSLDPEEFSRMVQRIREGKAKQPRLGVPQYGPQTKEEQHNLRYRRSLFVVLDIRKGEPFTKENIRSIRPGFGLPPAKLQEVLRSRAAKNIKRGTPLSVALISN